MSKFTPEELAAARAIFSGEDKDHLPCEHCGGVHARACPRIKRYHSGVTFKPDGITPAAQDMEVEYWPPGTWESSEVTIWPEEAFAEMTENVDG